MKLLKNMLTPPICAISVALSCAALFAEETITIDNVRQRTPWNGLVDIDYTIAGVTGDPNDYQIEFTMTVGSKSFVASNFWDAAWCDHATANGKQRATWNARADGIAAQTPVSVTAQLIYAPVTDASAEFAIVDLSSGQNSNHYPVRYVVGDTNRVAHFNIDTYKTRKLVLKKVHAGEFWMGEGNVSEGENRHRVRLTKDYFLGLFEVTRGQYKQVSQENPTSKRATVPGELDEGRPMNNLNWNEIVGENGFIAKVNARACCRGQSVASFGLPTEAQWEYACRAGTETLFLTGEDVTNSLPQYAWYNQNGVSYNDKKYVWFLHEVGRLLPNNWGFFDMAGNVNEFCQDWFASYPQVKDGEILVDPTGVDSGSQRVYRGGGYWNYVSGANGNPNKPGDVFCQSGHRNSAEPAENKSGHEGYYADGIGFRLCGSLK